MHSLCLSYVLLQSRSDKSRVIIGITLTLIHFVSAPSVFNYSTFDMLNYHITTTTTINENERKKIIISKKQQRECAVFCTKFLMEFMATFFSSHFLFDVWMTNSCPTRHVHWLCALCPVFFSLFSTLLQQLFYRCYTIVPR